MNMYPCFQENEFPLASYVYSFLMCNLKNNYNELDLKSCFNVFLESLPSLR